MIAPEQKARLTYDNILRLSDDPDVNNVIRFLREREIVHFQRFGECIRLCKEKMGAREVGHFQRFGEGLRLAKDKMNEKNVYYMNPAFDK